MTDKTNTWNWVLGLAGGAIGGALGYFAFFFIARQGFYAMVLPGALIGIGCGLLSGFKSTTLGVVCGVAALLFGLFLEWKFAPFKRDNSFVYFLSHVYQLTPVTLFMVALGGLFGFWFGRGSDGGVWQKSKS